MNIEIVNNEYNLPPYKHYMPVLKGKNNDNNTSPESVTLV